MFGFLSEWFGGAMGSTQGYLDATNTNSIRNEISDQGDKISRAIEDQTFTMQMQNDSTAMREWTMHNDRMHELDNIRPSPRFDNSDGCEWVVPVAFGLFFFFIWAVCKFFLFLFSL